MDVTTIKTGDSVSIEMNDITKAILEKYKDISFSGDRALPSFTNQAMNRSLKELCKLAEINDPIRITTYKGNVRQDNVYPKWELLDLANDTPFDDRANTSATIADVSQTLVRDFLVKTGSKLAQQIETEPFRNILEAMELLAGPREAIYPRNVALMMFNDHPEKFFPYLQVDITIFPKGKLKDPDNFIEVPSIKGPIDSIYRKTMAYLETNVIKENVQKRDYKPEADRAFNYPIHALEEIIGNCLYHYDYRKREPITIEIEPDAMYISNPGGPDRSLKPEDFTKSIVRPRQYRNRRIGDFFKELNITEGKSTGIPTINAAMKTNGSPAVRYEFDDSYSWFMATVPVHPVFLNDTVNETEKTNNVTVNDTVNGTVFLSELPKRLGSILVLIKNDDRITIDKIQGHFTVTRRTIIRDISSLKELGILIREGSDKTGSWVIVKKVIGL